ncbi:MAG TPA: hypothetical protein VKX28_21650 [Xanthobacteraceae bacterium]|nr:hypothetical protein [Xanthobacteraceae bacterium]
MDDIDPHAQIAALEARIDDLAERIERCRKIIFAAKIAIAVGAVTLLLLLIAVVRFDPVVMMAAVIAFIGGIVVSGTNASTAKQMAADVARAEAERSRLIDQLDLRPVVGEVDG